MKIYLGGKMTGHDRTGNWRNGIVDNVRADGNFGEEYQDGEGINLYAGCGSGDPPDSWPILRNAIFGKHDYVGPYLVGCDHGCFHSGDHATSIEWSEEWGKAVERRESNRKKIATLCWQAMITADISFFWFDSLDAYGTLAEFMFATSTFGTIDEMRRKEGKAERGWNFVVGSPSFAAIDEMWLAWKLASNKVRYVEAATPRLALEQAIALLENTTEYSPIEKLFIERWRITYGNGIVPQYNVPGFRYRVDFAFPDEKIAVELDGYEYHNSKEQFTNDRKRQREMELVGWRFIRFSGSEVYKDTDACVKQAYEFWQGLKV